MAEESISQIPQQALVVNGVMDLLEISQYTGVPGALYTTKKINPILIASTSALPVSTAIEFIVSSNIGYRIGTGLSGYIVAPYNGTITKAVLLADVIGSIVLNIWKCSQLQFDAGATHPVSGDTICGSSPPTISSGVIYSDSILTGWTLTFNAGDVFAFNVDSTSGTIGKLTLSLSATKTNYP